MKHCGHRSPLTGLGARLGILALVLQLVLSFAHIHPLPGSVTMLSAPAGNDSAPDLPQADGACAICAGLAAFAALDVPRPGELVPSASVAEILAPLLAVGAHRPVFVRYFSSRAPPAA